MSEAVDEEVPTSSSEKKEVITTTKPKCEDEKEEDVVEEERVVEEEEEEEVEEKEEVVEEKKEEKEEKKECSPPNTKELEALSREIEALREKLNQSQDENKKLFSNNAFLKENNARLENRIESLEQNTNVASMQDFKGRTTEKLVKLSEKNYHLAQKLKIARKDLEKRDEELSRTRKNLLEKLVGNSPCTPGEHVPITELLNLYIQSMEQQKNTTSTLDVVKATEQPVNSLQVESLRQTIDELKKHNRTLTSQINKMKDRIKEAKEKEDKIERFSSTSKSFSDKLSREKTMRSRAEKEVTIANEKIVKLSEHIEKLMVHLKHESTSKMKIQKTANRLEREVKSLTSRTSVLSHKNAERERIIAQLREGSKILEDQLRLMDKKYIELRSKLDWTRSNSKAVVKKMQKEANELRAKWALAGGLDMELSSTKKSKKKKKKKQKSQQPEQQQEKDITNELDESLPWSSQKIGQLTRDLSSTGGR